MEEWSRQSINFTVRLGEMSVLAWPLNACVLKTHFTKLPIHPTVPAELPKLFRDSVDVVVTRSHPIESSLAKLSILPQAIQYIPSSYRRYWVVLDGNFEDYLKKFSAKSRNTLLRKIKRFAEVSGGEIDWREYCKPEEMHEFYKLAMEVSQKTYQERLLDCGLPSDQQFQENMLALAAEDNVRGYLLFYQKKPIAYIYCPVHDGIALYEYVGHDPEYQRWSPGTLLQYFALQRMFTASHIKIFDFTEGEGAHKAFFATNNQYCADVYYFRRTWLNLIKVALHASSDKLSDGIVRMLDKFGVKAAIKKLFRSKA